MAQPSNKDAAGTSRAGGSIAPGWLARLPLELVIGVFVLVCLAIDVQAAPVGGGLAEGWWDGAQHVGIGIILAQPALLAVWAVLGPRRAIVQWPRALVLLALVWWADALGYYAGGWERERDPSVSELIPWDDFEYNVSIFAVCVALFLLIQLPAAVARLFWRWRISRSTRTPRVARRQFSLRQILGWTAFVAILLGGSRYLLQGHAELHFPKLRFDTDDVLFLGFLTRALFPLLLPAIPLTGLILGDRRRLAFLIVAIVCAVCGAVASVAQIADQNASVRLQDGVFQELGLCGATCALLWIFRSCGFRLAPFVARRSANVAAENRRA